MRFIINRLLTVRLMSDMATPDSARLLSVMHVAAACFRVYYYECPIIFLKSTGFRLPGRLKVQVARGLPIGQFVYCIGYFCQAT